MYNMMGAMRCCHAVKFDFCKNLLSYYTGNQSAVCQLNIKTKMLVVVAAMTY